MVIATYELKDDRYYSLDVKGHAEFGVKGKDLVCASVSSIMFGFMNALDELHEDVEIKQLANENIVINHSDSDIVQNYFELVMIQLKTIEESYGKYIRIERK